MIRDWYKAHSSVSQGATISFSSFFLIGNTNFGGSISRSVSCSFLPGLPSVSLTFFLPPELVIAASLALNEREGVFWRLRFMAWSFGRAAVARRAVGLSKLRRGEGDKWVLGDSDIASADRACHGLEFLAKVAT